MVSDTGATFRDVPIMIRRSTRSLSSRSERSNTSSSFSPKNMISGCRPVSHVECARDAAEEAQPLAFMIPGGYNGRSGSSKSDSSLSHPSFCFLPFFFLPAFVVAGAAAGGGWALHILHRGTRWFMMSSAISLPGTRILQLMHDAVAKEPWHWTTRCTPASVSSVSMFCV